MKTLVSVVCAAGSGVFSNTLVTEMTTPTGIAWGSFYATVSFYLVFSFLFLTFLYNRYLHVHESDVQNFRDSEYCVAYARSKLIPEQVEHYRQKIQSGQVGDFEAAMEELNRVLAK
jgi:hypothetical protein